MVLNIAVVGMGGIGNQHARIYRDHDNCNIVAICDAVKDKADEGAKVYDCRAFYSIEELLNSGLKVDVASVCTAGVENGGDHYAPTMKLLDADIAVLGEKPISNEVPKAEEMVSLARERGIRYGVNLNHRFTPAAREAKKWVDSGRLGELNIINMTMWINNPNESSPHFHMRALHPHSIDVMRYFCGDVEKIQAFFKKGKGRNIWSNVQVNMLFENGVVGHLTGSYDAGGSYGLETCEVVGSDGRFVLREACEQLEFYPRFSKEIEVLHNMGGMMGFSETFDSRITRWIEQNLDGVSPESIDAKAEDALRAQRIIESAIESWESNTVVTVKY